MVRHAVVPVQCVLFFLLFFNFYQKTYVNTVPKAAKKSV